VIMTEQGGRTRSSDRFLLGIVAGMVLLVGLAFALVLLQPQPTYQPDGPPEAVAHNFLLALRQEDDARAYAYLSPTLQGYPGSLEAFATDVRDRVWELRAERRAVALNVVETRIVGDRAWVTIRETWSEPSGLFNRMTSSSTFDVRLERAEVAAPWLIVSADRYWAPCWESAKGC